MASKAPAPSPSRDPVILIVPEGPRGGPDHWQARWENRGDCHRLDLGMWEDPHRNTWINKLNLAVFRAERPVLLVGHGLGCLTIAWWAEYEGPTAQGPVVGALMVAPPDPDGQGKDPRLAKFASCPRTPLPFPAIVVASANDPTCSQVSAIDLARDWACDFADAGLVGHLDETSNVGDWTAGQQLLGRFLAQNRPGYGEAPPLPQAAGQQRRVQARLDS